MIVYDGRLWFANSVKGRDNNSADIYSLDFADGSVRYEHALWSQDAGHPMVWDDLLYWPYEDALISGGWGTFEVTNGRDWTLGIIPTEDIFHVHDMAALDGRLYAATSAFATGLQVSDDRGKTWVTSYAHPMPDRKLRRLVRLATFNDKVFAELREPAGRSLLTFYGDHVTTPAGWPTGSRLSDLAPLGDWLYGLVGGENGGEVWRTDGLRVERLAGPFENGTTVDLVSDGKLLWALTRDDDGGTLWTSDNGSNWQRTARLKDGRPYDLLVAGGQPFVAGSGDDGHGIIWGTTGITVDAVGASPDLPDVTPQPYDPVTDWPAAAERLDFLLADPVGYEDVGLLIDEFTYNAAYSDPPVGFFEARLQTPRPAGPRDLFRDVTVDNVGDIGHFLLLRAMGFARQGRIDPVLLATPWTTPENSAQKYYDPLLAALWAAGRLDQDDRETVAVLVERLARDNEPLWLRGLVIGTLTGLTGKRFGHDVEAWQAWDAAQP